VRRCSSKTTCVKLQHYTLNSQVKLQHYTLTLTLNPNLSYNATEKDGLNHEYVLRGISCEHARACRVCLCVCARACVRMRAHMSSCDDMAPE
jgi:hypothetical protein